MKKKWLSVLLVSVLICILFSGCQNQTVLSQRLLIRGIGVDLSENGGYFVSIHVMRVDTGQTDEVTLYTAEGKSVLDALNNVTMKIGKTPLYSHNLIIVFGQECAIQGLDDVLDFFVRYNEARPTVDAFLSKTSALDILSTKKNDTYILTQDIDALAQSGELNSKIARSRVVDLINLSYRSGSPFLPELSVEGDEIMVGNTAVFHDNKLVGTLNESETRGFLLVREKLKNGSAVIQVPGAGRVTLSISNSERVITTEMVNGIPQFTIKIACGANISSIDGDLDAELGNEFYELFEKELEKQLLAQAESAIRMAINEYQSDIFDFGRILMQQQTDYWKEHESLWTDEMTKSVYKVNVKVKITRVGQEITPGLEQLPKF